MKKLVVSIVGVMVSTLAHATNGDTMMSVGSENTALGGTGVAHFVGAESTFANPAMLGKSTGSELVGGMVLFDPNVKNDGLGGQFATSSMRTSYIPDVSYASRINENLTYGLAMAGIAGMGVDYSGAPAASHFYAETELSILKVIPTIAYNNENYGLGFSPVLQYGSLDISYNAGVPVNGAQSKDSHTGYGYSLGGYYNATNALTLAASYNSKIKMNYGAQMSVAGAGFGQRFADELDQPAEIKAGVSFVATDRVTLTADYRLIQWANTAGYGDFGWQNQTVIATGAKYSGDDYWLGAGFNHSDNPIGVFANGVLTPAGNNGGVVNLFNNMMFPGIIKNSYTFGGGYMLNKHYELAGSVMYAPKVTASVDVSDAARMPPGSLYSTTTHSQQAFSISLRYKF